MIEILSPNRTVYWGRATSCTVRAVDGDVQVMAGHAPYVNVLASGEIRLHTEDKTCLHFNYEGGILEVARDKTSVLVDKILE
ncbi:MAG: hypothetical protein ABIE84_05715 [bacterium]